MMGDREGAVKIRRKEGTGRSRAGRERRVTAHRTIVSRGGIVKAASIANVIEIVKQRRSGSWKAVGLVKWHLR